MSADPSAEAAIAGAVGRAFEGSTKVAGCKSVLVSDEVTVEASLSKNNGVTHIGQHAVTLAASIVDELESAHPLTLYVHADGVALVRCSLEEADVATGVDDPEAREFRFAVLDALEVL